MLHVRLASAYAMIRKKLLTALQHLVASIVLIGFAAYLWAHWGEMAFVTELRWQQVSLFMILVLIGWILNSVQGYLLYRAAGIQIGFAENFFLLIATTLGNYLPGRGGTLVRAHYLKRTHDLTFARFGSIFTMRTLLTILSTGLTGLVTLLLIHWSSGRWNLSLVLVFTALSGTPFLIFLLSHRLSVEHRKGWHWGRIQEFLRGFHELKQSPAIGAIVVFFMLLQFAILGVRFHYAASLMGSPISPFFALFLAPVAALSTFIALTPGALGLREGLMGYAAFALNENFSKGLVIGTVDRAILLLMTALIGIPSWIYIWRRMGRK